MWRCGGRAVLPAGPGQSAIHKRHARKPQRRPAGDRATPRDNRVHLIKTMRELGLLCLCLCLPQALAFGSIGGSRTVSLVRRAGPFACEGPSVESRPAVSTPTAADKLAAELAERSASRPARPMSTGLPPPPGTDGLPVAIQAAIPILLCCIVTFGFDGGGWLYQ